jgi:O-succinylbenzoic acid--CoA ligase
MTDAIQSLSLAAQRFGHEPALILPDRTLSFQQLDAVAMETADKLAVHGVSASSRVSICAANGVEWITAFHAILKLGAIACPLNVRQPTPQLRELACEIECDNVIADSMHIHSFRSGKFNVIRLEELAPASNNARQRSDRTTTGHSSADPVTILFTSGSSGHPKPVLHELGAHLCSALGANKELSFGPGCRWLLSLPLYHVGGLALLFRSLTGSGAVVLSDSNETISGSLLRYDITHLSLVPTQLRHLLATKADCLEYDGLKIVVGGGPTPRELLLEAQLAGYDVYTTYGMTETASMVTLGRFEPDQANGMAGGPISHTELRLDADGAVLIKGATVAKGYVHQNTVKPLVDVDGWHHTQDIGELDKANNLIIKGRKDDMFISGGENVFPQRIESALASLSGMEECLVVGVKDDEFGVRPVAFVRLETGTDLQQEDISAHLKQRLARYEMPIAIYPWPTALMSAGLKPDRQAFSDLAARLIKKSSV